MLRHFIALAIWRFSSSRTTAGAKMCLLFSALALVSPLMAADPDSPQALSTQPGAEIRALHDERPESTYLAISPGERVTTPAQRWRHGVHVSVQVNVDEAGNNIIDDAANEPSIAVDLTDSNRMVIGWRQFDSIDDSFRQAGWGYSSDGGATWKAGVLEPGVFRSDPVLATDAQGNFYYNSLAVVGDVDLSFNTNIFRSTDGGVSWDTGVFAFGGDKQWMAIDRTDGLGAGNIYSNWSDFAGCCDRSNFNRSIDGGASYEDPIEILVQHSGTTAVGPEGEVYVTGVTGFDVSVMKSTTLRDPSLAPAFEHFTIVDLGGAVTFGRAGPNPEGLLGQVWVAVDSSVLGPRSGWVYVLASVVPPGDDPLDVHLIRSEDGGVTWSTPVKINDDPTGTHAWQWFATLSVAPNGRLDVVWNDSREDPGGFDSALYYAFSEDGGITWSVNEKVSPTFDPHLGWPQQNKIGDYYDMVSENDRVHVAYAATFNGEQDVFYLRLRDTGYIFYEGFTSGLGALSATVECGAGSAWFREHGCAASTSAPSPPEHAAWGTTAGGCSIYSTGQSRVSLSSPAVDIGSCDAAGGAVVEFEYLLDFREDFVFDRAFVEVIVDGNSRVLATNGINPLSPDPAIGCAPPPPGPLGNLIQDRDWHHAILPVGAGRELILRFLAETVDDIANEGQGFLIDDVRVRCGSELFRDGFESGNTSLWSVP